MDELLGEPRTILIAIDPSPGAEFAFDWTMKNYCKPTDVLHLLYVHRSLDDVCLSSQWRLPGNVAAKIEQESEAHADSLLRKFAQRAAEAKLQCKIRTVIGDEREEICKEVLWVCADALIVGSTGLNPVQRSVCVNVEKERTLIALTKTTDKTDFCSPFRYSLDINTEAPEGG